jgi:hypothetical protein
MLYILNLGLTCFQSHPLCSHLTGFWAGESKVVQLLSVADAGIIPLTNSRAKTCCDCCIIYLPLIFRFCLFIADIQAPLLFHRTRNDQTLLFHRANNGNKLITGNELNDTQDRKGNISFFRPDFVIYPDYCK